MSLLSCQIFFSGKRKNQESSADFNNVNVPHLQDAPQKFKFKTDFKAKNLAKTHFFRF
jgi:hypothetical protein